MQGLLFKLPAGQQQKDLERHVEPCRRVVCDPVTYGGYPAQHISQGLETYIFLLSFLLQMPRLKKNLICSPSFAEKSVVHGMHQLPPLLSAGQPQLAFSVGHHLWHKGEHKGALSWAKKEKLFADWSPITRLGLLGMCRLVDSPEAELWTQTSLFSFDVSVSVCYFFFQITYLHEPVFRPSP
jgi:hypothetical protein